MRVAASILDGRLALLRKMRHGQLPALLMVFDRIAQQDQALLA
jgi:hypothetical protein